MMMTPSLRKLALTVHVVASVGWVGALAVFLAHAIASLISLDEQIVRAACVAMGLTAWFVILPLSLTSLLTGLVQALGTAWGLFRHYWVLAKLLLTAFATAVLLLKMAPINYLAEAAVAATFSDAGPEGLRTSLMVHAVGGLLVLLAITTLAIYKPRGMTPYGVRKHYEHGGAQKRDDSGSIIGTPRWVKVSGVAVIVLAVLLGIMILHGSHGPSAHM